MRSELASAALRSLPVWIALLIGVGSGIGSGSRATVRADDAQAPSSNKRAAEDPFGKDKHYPQFVVHPLNRKSTYSAAAAVDVNKDGKLDVFCGGFWYEAPLWKKRFVREVQMIRGRYDGYSHLPLDVNGDGWTDIVNVNYRSRSIYWIRHPGESLKGWSKRLVAEPGPMETGRLVDVDGDGILDLLPNGVRFAAWWELRAISDEPVWARHDLPKELAGHGVGFGDIDGDGRGDMIGPGGWAQQPEDARRGRWIWRPEFRLHRDCGLPILVQDVDGDGDNDVIWSRGHRFGIYWLEQGRDGSGRTWTPHAIDTSWSQAHSLLWVDLDQDGQSELVAGKRYMGHDGRDPGEYDPLRSYAYQFDKLTRTWRRFPITFGGRVGFGLDPKAVDLDGDGDLDLLASGRSGLFWIENRFRKNDRKPAGDSPAPGKPRKKPPVKKPPVKKPPVKKGVTHEPAGKRAAASAPPAEPVGYHQQLKRYRGANGKSIAITSQETWALRRHQILQGLEKAMGPLPGPHRRVPLEVKIEAQERTPKYTRQRLSFASEMDDRVPAYLLIPHDLKGRGPAMLCLHQTTRIGKGEPAGLGGKPNLHYAHELANRGVVCLVPDYPSFGDYPFDFRKQGAHYSSGSMKAIWNNHRAVDLLEALPQVDPDRIGVIGHSLGGHNSLFTAVFDQRLQVIVTSCGFTAFHHYSGGKLAGWTSDRYMPRIRHIYQNNPNVVPFDFYEVIAALAPRTVLINAPIGDGNFEVNGVRKVVDAARPVFRLLGKADALVAEYPEAGHDFPTPIRAAFYDRILKALK